MALSLRIQNLAKDPRIQRSSFREMAAKMMGQKGVTKTARKEMQKAGVYFGGKKLSKVKFEKNLRKISRHLEEKGGKETRFAKQIRTSLRGKKGLIRGGTAERVFQKDIAGQFKEEAPKAALTILSLEKKENIFISF